MVKPTYAFQVLRRWSARTGIGGTAANFHKKKKICLFGFFGMENYGNDGSLESIIIILRQILPDAELSCVCLDPVAVERDHQIPSVPIKWPGYSNATLRLCDRLALTVPQKLANWVHAIRHLRQLNVMIVPGTSTLCDYNAKPFGAPYALFRWAVAARLCRIKVCFISTGAGPIHRRPSRWMLKYVAHLASYRSFRDAVSRDFLAGIGIDTSNDEIYPDLVFKLPLPNVASDRSPVLHAVTVGVGMMDYNGWDSPARSDHVIYDNYMTKMTRFVGLLLDHGYRVRVLIGESADLRAASDLRTMLTGQGYRLEPHGATTAEPGCLVSEPITSLHDLMQQMEDTTIVVASRFHNLVCAMKLARPAISLSYEKKNDELLSEMGLHDCYQHIEHFDTDRLMRQVTELLANRSSYEERIKLKLAQVHDRIKQQEQVLARIL